jgi:dCMP deaminase
MEERPSWEEYFKNIVLYTSTRSPCKRLKVGCILIKDNRIISQGYNGFLSGHPHESIVVHDHEISTIHAEQNAIIDCAKRGVSCNEAIAYITHFPCINCLKMLVQSGIKKIYYIHDYKNDTETIEKLDIKIPIIKMPNEKRLSQSN